MPLRMRVGIDIFRRLGHKLYVIKNQYKEAANG